MLSIVTLTYNNYDELVATIKSFENIKNAEIIVVNAGDCEKTRNFLAESKVITKHINEKDKGLADGINKGIKLCSGDLMANINSSDQVINSDYYNNVIEVFQKDSSIDFIHSNMILEDRNMGQVLIRPRLTQLGFGQPYLHPTMVVRSKIYDQIGNFNLNYKIGVDFELICRMHKAKMKGIYIDTKPVILMGGKGLSNTKIWKALSENVKALWHNDLLTFTNALGILVQISKISTKKILLFFGLNKQVEFIKKHLLN